MSVIVVLSWMCSEWSVSRKFLDSIFGNPTPMTHQPHEEIVFVMHKQSHKKTNAHRNPIKNCLPTCN